MSRDEIREHIHHRATGYEEPLVFQGRLTGDSIPKYDGSLLIAEAKYRDSRYGRVEINVNEIPVKLVKGISINEMLGIPPDADPNDLAALAKRNQQQPVIIDAEEIPSKTQKALPSPEELQGAEN